MGLIQDNIRNIYSNIEIAAKKSGRNISDITLIGVTKNVDKTRVKELMGLGINNIGENRVQELISKYPHVNNNSLKWHFIGNLQTNKVKYIIDKVSLIHSVNSVRLANEINKQALKIGKKQDILLEVNIAGEKSKMGVPTEDIDNLVKHISTLPNIVLKGLMAIAPFVDNPRNNKIYYENLKEIFIDINRKKNDNIDMKFLSMGMTNDYEVAIEEGANMIRIGTGIFGK